MAELTWDGDPVVRLEKAILPILSIAPDILCRLAMADDDTPDASSLLADLECFRIAELYLRDGGEEVLAPTGILLPPEDVTICVAAADIVAKTRKQLLAAIGSFNEQTLRRNGAGRGLADLIAGELRDSVNAAMDAFRRVFIGTVLKRQVVQADQAKTAVRQLSEISEMIFFIGVNASVEAARVGEAGRGFVVISEDLRRLASNARESTTNLQAVLNGTDLPD